MSTSLLNCEVELSKQLGDYWAGTTTSAGAAGGTSVIDTALMAKPNEWIDADQADMYDMITSGTYDEEERKISSLDNSTGTLTVLAHGGQIASSVTYRIHRLFTASEKRIALVNAAKMIYPHLFANVRDESLVSDNWLKDGGVQIYTSSSALTYWTASGVTVTKNTTLPYYKHGSSSVKLDTAAGYIYQDISLNDILQDLAGKTVTFTGQGWCNTASCLRLGILYDGTNLTYSDYHDGDSAFTEDDDPLEVEYKIDDNPTDVEFRVYHAVAAGTSYVNDLRVIADGRPRLYIGGLGLSQNKPHRVQLEPASYSNDEPWIDIPGVTYDQTNGYMYLPSWASADRRLRILGDKYLDFYDTSGDSGTDWDDTIAIDSPQLVILVAQAAVYLCNQKIIPSNTAETNQAWSNAKAYWEKELAIRKNRFGMQSPSATVSWGI